MPVQYYIAILYIAAPIIIFEPRLGNSRAHRFISAAGLLLASGLLGYGIYRLLLQGGYEMIARWFSYL
jgi:high-affinity Fe2+/Pb2+ permease